MMKKYLASLTLACALLGGGCNTTPQKTAVNSLTSIGQAVNASYEAYLSQVITGALATNDVPKVTALYREFQAGFSVAAAAAHFTTNTTLATPELVNLANQLTTAVTTIQKGGK